MIGDWYLAQELQAARLELGRWQALHLEMALRLRRGQRSGLVVGARRAGPQGDDCRLGRCLVLLSQRRPGDPFVEELSWVHDDFHAYADAVRAMIAAGRAEEAIVALTGLEYEARRAALTDRITELLGSAA